MYLTLIYRDEFVRSDFPKKQFYTISKDLKSEEIDDLVKYWKFNPFIETVYINSSVNRKINNFEDNNA